MFLLFACASIDPAPADLDGLVHYLWQHYDAGTDAELAEAVVNLDAAVASLSSDVLGDAAAYLTEPLDAGVSEFTVEEQALVLPGDSRDPALTRGFVVVNPLPCTMEQAERFVYAADQMALYPEAYTSYTRAYTSDLEAYTSRAVSTLTWTTDLTAVAAGFTYRELLEGEFRQIPSLDAELSPFGWFAVNRTWLTEPACFGDDCDNDSASFEQDFQLEIQYERTAGTVVHVYVIWRQAEYFGLDQDNDGLQSTQIDGLLDWDADTAALCVAEASDG